MRWPTLVLFLAACGGPTEAPAPEVPEVAAPVVVPVTSRSPEAVAAFERGRRLQENYRAADALAAYDEALALDPDFAQAHAHRGQLIEGSPGLQEMRKAAELAAHVPESERLVIQGLLAMREGDAAKATERFTAAAALAPDDPRPQLVLGVLAWESNDYAGAVGPLKRATELDPKSGSAWNLLGYSYAFQGDYDAAIAALEEYTKVEPTEANPHDSLGEVRMMAGRLEEAEAAFVRATEVSPSFWPGFAGAAQSRFLRADWEGGREMLGKAIAATTRPQDRIDARRHLAWSWFAAGDDAQAAQVLAEAETEAAGAALPVTHAWIAADRAEMALLSNDWAAVLAHADEEGKRAEAVGLEGEDLVHLRLHASVVRVIALSMSGRVAETEGGLAAIDADAAKTAGTEWAPLVARGAVALGNADATGAVASLSQCQPRESTCLWLLAQAQERAGDTAAAEATRERLLALHDRGGHYLGVWAKSGGPSGLAATAGE